MVNSTATTHDLSLLLLEHFQAREAALKAEIEGLLAPLVGQLATVTALRKLLEMALPALDAPSVAAAPPHASVAHGEKDVAPEPASALSTPILGKPMSDWVQILGGMPQRAALRRIAQENGGILRTTEAGHILVAAGLITGNARYAGSHLYAIVMRSPHFERIAPGTFRLVTAEAPADAPSLAGTRAGGADDGA
jgi:hypothetical protein